MQEVRARGFPVQSPGGMEERGARGRRNDRKVLLEYNFGGVCDRAIGKGANKLMGHGESVYDDKEMDFLLRAIGNH